MKALVMFYSTYGHTWQIAEAVKEGIHEVTQDVTLKRIPELLSDSVLKALRALEFQKKMEHIPVVSMEELADYDLLFFGSPTRFGNMIGQMRMFLDSTGPLWSKNALTGKVGSCFTSSGTQHGGQESTILSMYNTLIHHGMIVVGLPYSFTGQSRMDEITGCSPYGTSTISGPSGERMPSENELNGARFQGKFAARIAKRIFE
ncbi:MAG: NAD(P)H:quinone oxidoreductase [Fibrobacter sp.]|nr:NAD(P)H:quinone oxidoreductase [Fibrobacter sp.]